MHHMRCSVLENVFVLLVVSFFGLLLSPANLLGADHVIGAASSMVNFFPDVPPSAEDLAKELTLSAARGESESAQIVVAAGAKSLDIQRVEVSDLRCGKTRIHKDSITVHLVGYVEIKENENSWRGIKRPGLWPDPLLRFRPFICPVGETRSLWVTVQVPRNARPGRYKGSITLYLAGSREVQIPIRLTVRNFLLPKSPKLRTSYWTHIESEYDLAVEPEVWLETLKLFSEYRISTDLWPSWNFRDPGNMREWVVLWYLEEDGTMTCDISGMQHTIEFAVEAGFSTLQIGHGCWMGSEFDDMPLIDRKTGRLLAKGDDEWESAFRRISETLDAGQKEGFPGTYFARLFLPQMCDWLESKGLLECSYMQLYDEATDTGKFPYLATLYNRYRLTEPRLKLLGLTMIHPSLQGSFDIWSPYVYLYDPKTYDMVRQGISLRGPKNFKAKVTASSSGIFPTCAHYNYQPIDGYDGCEYTKWTPAAAPGPETPQWLRFDFDGPQQMDGIRIVPFPYLPASLSAHTYWVKRPADTVWFIEASVDGQTFQPLKLTKRAGVEGGYSFPLQPVKAVRLVHAKWGSRSTPTDPRAVLTVDTVGEGVREVEFLREGLPLEAMFRREKVRPAEMWEYQVGATYPSACIDADPSEIRATGWQCWQRGLVGWLNAGGAQWTGAKGPPNQTRPKSENRLVWSVPPGSGRGSPWIVYPGKTEVLASIRLARFRDGVDDYDYLTMLCEKQPNHPVLKLLREGGRLPYAFTLRWAWSPGGFDAGGLEPYSNVQSMLKARAAVAKALDEFSDITEH